MVEPKATNKHHAGQDLDPWLRELQVDCNSRETLLKGSSIIASTFFKQMKLQRQAKEER